MAAKFTRFSEKRDTTGSDATSYDDAVDGIEPDESAGLHIPLPESNMGFLLMQKMGWSSGVGLGKNGQGRTDPVPLELKSDYMGLGRFQMELDLASEATEKRKQLEIEKELTPGLIDKYKTQVAKEQAIADATSDMRKTYHCELCEKQYTKYSEYDNHLNSYDHHHRQVSILKSTKESERKKEDSEKNLKGRLKDLKQFDTGLKTKSHRSTDEHQKKASLKMVAKERAQMKVERYHQWKEGGSVPGFKPLDSRRKRSSSSQATPQSSSLIENERAIASSKEAIASAVRKRNEEEIAESEKKIAEKKVRLAKYGVKFESAGHLATIQHKEMSSYQSSILNAVTSTNNSDNVSLIPSTTTSNSLYGRFVSASTNQEEEDGVEDTEKREKRLSELPQASGRMAEQLAAAEKNTSSDEEEDFTQRNKFIKRKETKKAIKTKQMTLKLTDKYESYYY